MYSSNGTTWTQLASPVTITAMPATADAGLIASAAYNPQLTDASFANVNVVVATETFAIQNGSTLNINLSSAGPVALSESADTITATQNGTPVSFTGITTIAVTDTGSGDTLNFNGPITIPFTFTNTASAIVDVNSGTLTFAAVQGGSVTLGTLSIASDATAAITPTTSQQPTTLNLTNLAIDTTGTFDVANNVVFINYGSQPDPITTIAGWLTTGYNTGSWNGPGIISTIAQTNTNYALGYADGADPQHTATGLASGTIEIKYTLLGDADLNGIVNGIDFGILSANFNKGITGWDEGDFDYNNIVNGLDFGDLSANFNKGANIAAAVPVVSSPITTIAPTDPNQSPATKVLKQKTPARTPSPPKPKPFVHRK